MRAVAPRAWVPECPQPVPDSAARLAGSGETGQRRADLGVAPLGVWVGPAPPHACLDRERRPVVVLDAFDLDLDRDDALGHAARRRAPVRGRTR